MIVYVPSLDFYYREVRGISPPLVHYFGPEMGEWVRATNLTELVVVNAHYMGVVSARVAHNLDDKTVELSAKRMVQGR